MNLFLKKNLTRDIYLINNTMKSLNKNDKIVPAPTKPKHLAVNIQWLSGEGCGSWFHIERENQEFAIARYSPTGEIECKGIFEQTDGATIDLTNFYSFTYLSHCSSVKILQKERILIFKLVEKC